MAYPWRIYGVSMEYLAHPILLYFSTLQAVSATCYDIFGLPSWKYFSVGEVSFVAVCRKDGGRLEAFSFDFHIPCFWRLKQGALHVAFSDPTGGTHHVAP